MLTRPAPTLACLTSRHCELGSNLTHGIGLRLVHMSALHVLARGIVLAGMELGTFVPIVLPTARALGGFERAEWWRRGPLQLRAPHGALPLLGARGCSLQMAGT